MSENGQLNRIIGEPSINGSVQFIRLYDTWEGVLPYITNPRDPEATSGWGSTGSANSARGWGGSSVNSLNLVNPSFAIVTRIWGGIFTNYTVNWSGSVNASPDFLPHSPVFTHVV